MKLSFVIPSFNDERIVETINSINAIKTTRTNLEIIVQDGGSEASVLQKIRSVLCENDKLVVELDNGIFDGINRGIKNATGDMILTLGTDDRVYDQLIYDKILKEYEAGTSLINVGLAYTDENWKVKRKWIARKFSILRYIIGIQYAHFGLVCTPEVYKKFGSFNTVNKVNADYEFFHNLIIRMKDLKLRQAVIADICIQMKLGGNSSRNIRSILRNQLIILKYILKNDVRLLPGLFLKPFWKILEILRA
jgi:glycosyltransferase involved in cell wall biosynthesis